MSTPAPATDAAVPSPVTKLKRVKAKPFPEKAGTDVFNASELVPLDDGRFLVCDNNLNGELLEMRLGADGHMIGGLRRHPLRNLPVGAIDDMEGMTIVRHGDRRVLYVSTSLSLKKGNVKAKKRSERGVEFPPRNALLRVSIGRGTRLTAEVVPDFKHWLVERHPEIAKASRRLPDDNGLNVEGLGWDPNLGALLLGVRTPVIDGHPLVLRVRIKDPDGPWELSNFEALAPIRLEVEDVGHLQGARSIEFDPSRNVHLVVIGNSTSASKAPFSLYAWDGNEAGRMTQFRHLRFARAMRPEGVAHGTIGGRGCIVFVDDTGGYTVVFDDDPRLAIEPRRRTRGKAKR